jgi:hypothetical protein
VVGEVLSGSADYIPEWAYQGIFIGGFSLGGVAIANLLAELKEGVVGGRLEVETDDDELPDNPSPADIRAYVQKKRDLENAYQTLKVSKNKEREDVIMRINKSDIEVTLPAEAKISSAVEELLSKAEGLQNEMGKLPQGMHLEDDGLVIQRKDGKAKQLWEEVMSASTVATALNGKMSLENLFEDLNSDELLVDDAARMIEGLSMVKPELIESFTEGDTRNGVEDAIEDAMERKMKG